MKVGDMCRKLCISSRHSNFLHISPTFKLNIILVGILLPWQQITFQTSYRNKNFSILGHCRYWKSHRNNANLLKFKSYFTSGWKQRMILKEERHLEANLLLWEPCLKYCNVKFGWLSKSTKFEQIGSNQSKIMHDFQFCYNTMSNLWDHHSNYIKRNNWRTRLQIKEL